MKKIQKKDFVDVIKISIEKIAQKKVESNCMGLFYEPAKPSSLIKKKKMNN